jgi:hypothetical protein
VTERTDCDGLHAHRAGFAVPFTKQPEQAEDFSFDGVDRKAFFDLCAALFDDTTPRSACE